MSLESIPADVQARYRFKEWNHACAILATDFTSEFQDLMDWLRAFVLTKSDILTPGGRRSSIPDKLNGFLDGRGWAEKAFDIEIVVGVTLWMFSATLEMNINSKS